jgi:hypothetical protein
MLRKFKITFISPKGKKKEVVLEATSKYDAKLRFTAAILIRLRRCVKDGRLYSFHKRLGGRKVP